MPNKRPPNAEATQFRSGEQAVENGRKGGVNSGIARREKKTVQKILGDYLDLGITENRTLEALARKVGISTDGSIKDLVTAVCVLNTLKNGELKDLELMMKLLGETPTPETPDTADETEDALSKALREEAERMQNGTD